MVFELHERLQADTIEVCELELCKVLLMNDENYPWLILVPMRENTREVHQLFKDEQYKLMDEISHVSAVLERFTEADKMNIGALGNMVHQLHVHVIARFKDDPAWPNPVWGAKGARAYDEEHLQALAQSLRDKLTN